MNDRNLLDLKEEALKQNAREKELDRVIQFFKARQSIDDDQKFLYIKTLLMSGKLNRFSAFRREVKAVVMGSEILRNSGFLS